MAMNEEAQKALDQLKADLKGEILTEQNEQLAGLVSKEVIAKMEEVNKALKPSQPTEKEVAENNLKYFKAKFKKDIHGEHSEDLKLGKKDLDTTTDGSGDELVPDGFGSEVIRIATKTGMARQNSRVITLPSKIYTLPTIGDATANRTDEKAVIAASSPTTGGLTFTAKKLAGMVIATVECIQDANVDVINWIQQLLGEAVAYKEDYWAFRGLTATEGLFGSTTAGVYTLGSGETDFEDVDLDDARKGIAMLDPFCIGNARFVWSYDLMSHFMGIKNTTTGLYLWGNPAGLVPTTLWGVPHFESPVMPVTTQTDSQADSPFMAVYDPRYLMIGDRRSISLEFSKDATVVSSDGQTSINLFAQDMVAIKVTERIDIQVAEPAKSVVRFETAAS